MNVAQITLGLGEKGGVENFVRDLSLGLSANGHRVTAAASRIDLPGFSTGLNTVGSWRGIKVARVKKYNLPAASIYSFSSNGMKLLKGRRMDIVHSHSLPSPGYLGSKLSQRSKAPLVVTLHGGEVNILSRKKSFRLINQQILDRADAVVCVSKELKKRTIELFGKDPRYIPNGVDTARFFPAGEQRDIDVLFVGMLREEKGVDVLLRAIKGTKLRTVIAGSGPLGPKLKNETAALGLKKIVGFNGFVKNDELPRLLNRAKVLALPSRTEGMSLALLEAMACGTVPVATSVGGTASIVRDGRDGFLVPPEDPGALRAALKKAFSDQARLTRMSRTGCKRIVRDFKLKMTVEKYEHLYGELI